MEFRLDEGQVELQETVARFCAARFPLDGVVAREGAPARSSGLVGAGRPRGAGTAGRGGRRRVGPRCRSRGRSCSSSSARTSSPARCCGRCWPPGWSRAPPPATSSSAAWPRRRSSTARRSSSTPPTSTSLLVVHDDAVVSHRATDLPPPVALDPLDPLTPGRPGHRADRRRGDRRRARRPSGSGCSARCSAPPLLTGLAGPIAGGGARLRPRAAAVRRADRVVPGREAPPGRHVRPQRARPERDLRCRRGAPGSRPRRPAAGGFGRQAPRGEAAIANASTADPGARRDGLHLGHAPQPPPQAGVGARARLRRRRRSRRIDRRQVSWRPAEGER